MARHVGIGLPHANAHKSKITHRDGWDLDGKIYNCVQAHERRDAKSNYGEEFVSLSRVEPVDAASNQVTQQGQE